VTKVLVRLPNHVGDACMALPALHALRAAGLNCALAGKPWGGSLLASLGLPYLPISGQLLADRATLRGWLASNAGEPRGLVLPNSFGSALLFALAGVPSAGLATDFRRLLLRWPIPAPGECHEVERFHAAAVGALEAWGRRVSADVPPELGLRLTVQQIAEAAGLLQQHGVDRYALLAPVATGRHHGRAKHWEHFAELVPALQARGLQAVAAPTVQEAEAVRAALPGAMLLPPVALGVYAALSQRAAVAIANDSGSSHVAAAVGARQVTIFGVTDRHRTGPWSPRAVCVGAYGAWPGLPEVIMAIDQALALP
jgi:heptosyltransferase-2